MTVSRNALAATAASLAAVDKLNQALAIMATGPSTLTITVTGQGFAGASFTLSLAALATGLSVSPAAVTAFIAAERDTLVAQLAAAGVSTT